MKVAIIGGGGRVGSNAALCLQFGAVAREIVLVDVAQDLAAGEALDLRHGSALAGAQVFTSGSTGKPKGIEGTHRLEGMLAVCGDHVVAGKQLDASIADIAPTVLAGLGLPVPVDMEGRVLADLFDESVQVQYEPPQRHVSDQKAEEVYTAQQRVRLGAADHAASSMPCWCIAVTATASAAHAWLSYTSA